MISGTPTAVGAYDFVVRARNAIGEEFSVGTVDIARRRLPSHWAT
ncbi:MAG: hypothetical protein WKH64_06485 [Chloroflexia bacterium]